MGDEGLQAPIQKGPVHQAIDALVNRRDATRQALLDGLKAIQPADDDHTIAYLAVLQQHLTGLNIRFLDYLHDRWYSPNDAPPPRPLRANMSGFWPLRYHPTEPIVRKGLIKAIELAIATNLPLESYWMLGGERFETIVIQSAQQIVRLILTPPTPLPSRLDHITNAADLWVIKRGPVALYETAEDASGPVVVTKLHKTSSPW